MERYIPYSTNHRTVRLVNDKIRMLTYSFEHVRLLVDIIDPISTTIISLMSVVT